MLSGLSKRILMVMFTLFTETNVGPCTIHHGANVGNSKTSHLTNIWMSENFKKKVLPKTQIKYLSSLPVEKLRTDTSYL